MLGYAGGMDHTKSMVSAPTKGGETSHAMFEAESRCVSSSFVAPSLPLATAWIQLRQGDGGNPGTVTLRVEALDEAARALEVLQAHGWHVTFDPGRYLLEGYVEFCAEKRVPSESAARAELEMLDVHRAVSHVVLDEGNVEFRLGDDGLKTRATP